MPASQNCGCSDSGTRLTDAQVRWLFGSIGGGLSLLTLPFIAYAVRGRIIADAHGLKWRSIRKWKTARWSEITDTYALYTPSGAAPTGGEGASLYKVETVQGDLAISTQGHTNVKPLLAAIQDHCGTANEDAWKEKGTRAKEDVPVLLHYRQGSFWLAVVSAVLFASGWLWLTVHMISWIIGNFQLMGAAWGIGIGLTGALFGIFLSVPAIMFTIMALTAHRCRNQQISVYRDGLTFEDTGRLLEVGWHEVECVNHAPPQPPHKLDRCTIETQKGNFDVYPTHLDSVQLRIFYNLLKRYAPESVKRGEARTPKPNEVLSVPVPERPDQKLYTCRTRTNRALLVPASSLAAIVWLVPVLRLWLDSIEGIPPGGSIWLMVMLALPFTVIALLSLYAYLKAGVMLDDAGITSTGYIPRRTLRWNDITFCTITAGQGITLAGGRTRISVSPLIGNYDDLAAEIKRRVPRKAQSIENEER